MKGAKPRLFLFFSWGQTNRQTDGPLAMRVVVLQLLTISYYKTPNGITMHVPLVGEGTEVKTHRQEKEGIRIYTNI